MHIRFIKEQSTSRTLDIKFIPCAALSLLKSVLYTWFVLFFVFLFFPTSNLMEPSGGGDCVLPEK